MLLTGSLCKDFMRLLRETTDIPFGVNNYFLHIFGECPASTDSFKKPERLLESGLIAINSSRNIV